MRSTIYITLVIALFPTFVCAQKTTVAHPGAQFINFIYEGVIPPNRLPNGVKHLGGGLIGDVNADPVYGISQTEKGTLKMFWLEVSIGLNAKGVTEWQVLDVLSFQNVPKGDYLFFAGDPSIMCTRNSAEIPDLVGRGRIIRNKGSFVPSKLWVADISKKKFVSLAMDGVKCEYSEP
ncbi:MAG TPA: hypothetical protein PKD26_11000 [Pyrinomonadaceae bacterium]|nr:hypothetical protein [Pyrinomonadaceae bacterium]